MNNPKIAAWSEELQELRDQLDSVAKRRARVHIQMRALESLAAILRSREQELTREMERSHWGALSHNFQQV